MKGPSFGPAARAVVPGLLEEWRDYGACRGYWRTMEEDPRKAKLICGGCPVLSDCRAWVLRLPKNKDVWGFCGGLTRGQRIWVRSKRRKARDARVAAGVV